MLAGSAYDDIPSPVLGEAGYPITDAMSFGTDTVAWQTHKSSGGRRLLNLLIGVDCDLGSCRIVGGQHTMTVVVGFREMRCNFGVF